MVSYPIPFLSGCPFDSIDRLWVGGTGIPRGPRLQHGPCPTLSANESPSLASEWEAGRTSALAVWPASRPWRSRDENGEADKVSEGRIRPGSTIHPSPRSIERIRLDFRTRSAHVRSNFPTHLSPRRTPTILRRQTRSRERRSESIRTPPAFDPKRIDNPYAELVTLDGMSASGLRERDPHSASRPEPRGATGTPASGEHVHKSFRGQKDPRNHQEDRRLTRATVAGEQSRKS